MEACKEWIFQNLNDQRKSCLPLEKYLDSESSFWSGFFYLDRLGERFSLWIIWGGIFTLSTDVACARIVGNQCFVSFVTCPVYHRNSLCASLLLIKFFYLSKKKKKELPSVYIFTTLGCQVSPVFRWYGSAEVCKFFFLGSLLLSFECTNTDALRCGIVSLLFFFKWNILFLKRVR